MSDTFCQSCGDYYELRDGCQPTTFCDPCAHKKVEELSALLERVGEALRLQDQTWGLYGDEDEAKEALADFEKWIEQGEEE